jgi:hypothetical protein
LFTAGEHSRLISLVLYEYPKARRNGRDILLKRNSFSSPLMKIRVGLAPIFVPLPTTYLV